MKLPSLWPAAFFAGGILLSGKLAGLGQLAPILLVITPGLALLLALGFLHFNFIRTATLLSAVAWLSLGFAAAKLESTAVPRNLVSTLIDSGKLDSSVPLRWSGRLRADPQRLPWGTRYEIDLEEVESSAGPTPVTGGLRLTLYRDEAQTAVPPTARAGNRVEAFVHAVTIRNFGNPGMFDNREFLARQGIHLQATLRNPQLLTILGSPRLTIAHRLARGRGNLLAALDGLLGDHPAEAALARAMLLGDRSFVEQDRIVDFQRTRVYHILVLAGLHVGVLIFFFAWAGRRLRLALLPRTILTLAALAAYAGIVEDRPPILRAALMAAIFLSARLFYLRMDLLNVAALSALVILVARPSEITDASFLLSISAVAIPYLWSRGLQTIDVVALTHAHLDHLGGLPAILQNFHVRELWLGHDIESGAYRHLLDVAASRGVRIVHMKQGDSFSRNTISGTVLWPEQLDEEKAAKNDDSLVMRLTDGTQAMLLAGDIERPTERRLLSEGTLLGANFLKVAHHGSKTSTTDPFLSDVHPAFAAISVGRDNSFGHPSPEVIKRLQSEGVRVYRTDRDGAITASTDGRTLTVSTFLHSNP